MLGMYNKVLCTFYVYFMLIWSIHSKLPLSLEIASMQIHHNDNRYVSSCFDRTKQYIFTVQEYVHVVLS